MQQNNALGGIVRKSALLGAQEGLEGHFANVFDIDIVLGYKMAEFFDFCRYLTFYGYKADGFEGKLSAPEELVRNHVGNCWDQTELQREWFEKHGHEVKIYLLYYYVRDDLCPSHSILAFRGKSSDFGGEDGTKKGLKQGFRDGFKEGKWYWFEPMFGRSQGDSGDGLGVEYAGIHEYDSERELLADFWRVFGLNGQRTGKLPEKLEKERWALYEYERPEYGISDVEFYNHCRMGRKIEVGELGI